MGEDLLAVGHALQLLVGVAAQLGLDAQLLDHIGVELVTGEDVALLVGDLAGGLGLGADLGLFDGGELLAGLFGLGPGLLHRLIRIQGLGGLGQAGLILQRIVPGMQVLGAGVELVIAVGHDDGTHEGEQENKDQHRGGHHGHRVFAQAAPGVGPVGDALALGNEVGLFLLIGGGKVSVAQSHDIFVVDLERAHMLVLVCHDPYLPPFARLMRGSTSLYSRSTTRFISTMKVARKMVVPIITG